MCQRAQGINRNGVYGEHFFENSHSHSLSAVWGASSQLHFLGPGHGFPPEMPTSYFLSLGAVGKTKCRGDIQNRHWLCNRYREGQKDRDQRLQGYVAEGVGVNREAF